jgi:hypothetical protein
MAATGLAEHPGDLPAAYGVTPSGRAPDGLRFCYETAPAAAFKGQACREELFDTSHFHLDGDGNLITGLCAGIAAAGLPDLHPYVAPATHPAFIEPLQAGCWVMEHAGRRHGFVERPGGYVSKCDPASMCADASRYGTPTLAGVLLPELSGGERGEWRNGPALRAKVTGGAPAREGDR